jgi:hypothetical protein
LTSSSEIRSPFTQSSDREGDDKVLGSSGYGFVPKSRRATQMSMPFLSLTGLKDRWRERVDASARGSDVPAGIDRGADAVAPTGSRERGRLRRRLRELRRLREAQLLELGALVLEAHKHGRDDSPVIKTKAAEAAATDAEARAVADALDTGGAGLDTIVTAGIAGPCPTCGTLASTAARFCSTCGTPLDGRPGAAPRTDRADAPDTPLADARAVDADSTAPDEPTAEMPASNGNGTAPEELETARGEA